MSPHGPPPRRLVLVGGGHSHVHVLKALGENPVQGLEVTLVAREVRAPYSGMLPGLVAGHYRHDEAHIDLRRLCDWAGIGVVADEAVGLDPEARRVLLDRGASLRYDLLSLNVGGVPAGIREVPGVDAHALAVKPVSRFLARWRRVAGRAVEGADPFRVAVVGGGAGGVELGLAARHRLRALMEEAGGDPDRVRLHLFTDDDRIVPDHPDGVGRRLRRILERRRVRVHAGAPVVRVEPDAVVTAADRRHPAEATLWVTGVTGPAWLRKTGLETTGGGFVRVDATLRSVSHPSVFAAGDVAHVDPYPRPRAGVFAVRQGPPLDRNLRRVVRGASPEPHEPQERFLSLISTGDRYAVGSWAFLSFEGRWAWRLKDWIDRRWMARWSDLPA